MTDDEGKIIYDEAKELLQTARNGLWNTVSLSNAGNDDFWLVHKKRVTSEKFCGRDAKMYLLFQSSGRALNNNKWRSVTNSTYFIYPIAYYGDNGD